MSIVNNLMSRFQLRVTLDVAWDRIVEKKQTLFPVLPGEDKKAIKGFPPTDDYTLRATKCVNMHPFPTLNITYEDGSPYVDEEEFRLSLVSAHDKKQPLAGSCTCGGEPILTESKPFQLIKKKGHIYGKMREGKIEFTKMQIGCCTGQRGHGNPLCLKAEFVREGSPLRGMVAYSRSIEVGAKGPFAKIFQLNQALQQQSQQLSGAKRPRYDDLPLELVQSQESYSGASEMVDLLKALNLHKYIPLFIKHEIDLAAFLKLTDQDLTEMGITLVGPKVKILKAINEFEAKSGFTPSLPKDSLEDSSMWAFSPALEPIQFDQIEDRPNPAPPAKRQKLVPTPPVFSYDMDKTKMLSIYVYFGFITGGKNGLKKKILFMVKSKKDFSETDKIVQLMKDEVVASMQARRKNVQQIEKAQVMLILQPDKNGDWSARSHITNQFWSFKKGDYIKIDNHHHVDIGIQIHHFLITDNDEPSWIEDFCSPKKYPVLFPGGSLEIGIDENREGRLALAQAEADPSEIFAITHHGAVVGDPRLYTETCVFSFKRRKVECMKKVDSLDDLQKELFLATCLDPTILA